MGMVLEDLISPKYSGTQWYNELAGSVALQGALVSMVTVGAMLGSHATRRLAYYVNVQTTVETVPRHCPKYWVFWGLRSRDAAGSGPQRIRLQKDERSARWLSRQDL